MPCTPAKIVIADVKFSMKTSFLTKFMSLGDQGHPAEPPKPPWHFTGFTGQWQPWPINNHGVLWRPSDAICLINM